MTHGSREETGVRSPDCGGGDLVQAGGGREVSRVDDGGKRRELRNGELSRSGGAVAGGKRGCDRIVEDLSSVGVRSTITVSFAVPSWQQAMRRSPFPLLFLVTTKDRRRCWFAAVAALAGWLAGWLHDSWWWAHTATVAPSSPLCM